jgi:DNA replication and repair protein RecF
VQELDRGDLQQLHDVAIYGSRGQQRLAVLWLKVCQLDYLSTQTNERPLLLLDDILSELDTRSRGIVLSIMKQGQSIITTASKGIAERIQKSFPECSRIAL